MTTSTPNTIATDLYPTRKGPVCTVVDRPDPVVWSGLTDGSLHAAELARYEDKGFHVMPSVLSSGEVAACYSEIGRLATSPDLAADPRVIREQGTGDVRSIFDVHLLSSMVAEVARRPNVLGVAQQILGSDVYIHQSRLNFKPGFTGGPFYWHSDFETWHAEDGMPRPRAMSMSIALTPNYEVNGSLMIIAGSHQRFVSCAGETPKDYFQRSLVEHIPVTGSPDHATLTGLANEFGIEQITGPAGSATVFDSNCMHGSNGNITPYPRSNIFLVFNSVENTLGQPFSAPAPRPEFLAKRDFTPLRST
ncbi:ectoine hydroxylase [Antrihabitans spumae]|jgi:ectoine hydroxylase|uniref:Ectoine hydroxylase n=1 Tax=Antrihabitans spumae TaxID=3373370 RepID=A0ABW7K1H8_9NOCA